MTRTGIVVKSVSGFYTVASENDLIQCRARGHFRKEGMSPLTGDRVVVTEDGSGAVLEQILPRQNAFVRPPVANVDQLVVFASDSLPVTDPFLIDRICVVAAAQHVNVVLCVNKCDLPEKKRLAELYRRTGIPTISTSAETGEGIPALFSLLKGRFSVFTGNSGVGKSSILNRLDGTLRLPTGEVSQKLGRGRHTTRHVEIFVLPDHTYIADTPGFSAFDTERFSGCKAEELFGCFPEFQPYAGKCRFADCTHRKEDGCALRRAVECGSIEATRYESFLRLYEIAKETKPWL